MGIGRSEAMLLELTEEQIRAFPAGRELDRYIARSVDPKRHKGVPAYSTDAGIALALLKSVGDACGWSDLYCGVDGWNIDFTDDSSGLVVIENVEEFPLAICRAALLETFLLKSWARDQDLELLSSVPA